MPEINELKWKLDNVKKKLSLLLRQKVEIMKNRYNSLINSKALKNPYDSIRQKMLLVEKLEESLKNKFGTTLKDDKIKLVKLVSKLETLSPLKTLTRGYSIVENEEGTVLTSTSELISGEKISIILSDGKKGAVIE